jgi:hypothetical protein
MEKRYCQYFERDLFKRRKIMRYWKFLFFMVSCFNLFAYSYKEEIIGKEKIIGVENEYLKVQFTTSGGRIKSLVNKKNNNELVFWSPGEGGWLDDRGTKTMANYEYKLLKRDKERINFIFTILDDTGLYWEKEITMWDKLPVIDVKYKIKNKKRIKVEYEHMVRNFVIPGGNDFGDDDYILYHDSEGLQKIKWRDIWVNKRTSSWYVNDVIYKWGGIFDEGNKVGCIFIFNDIDKLYYWAKSGKWGTAEWIFPKKIINPNEEVNFEAKIVITDDIPSYTNGTDDYIISLPYIEKQKNFDFEIYFKPISEIFLKERNVRIQTKIFDLKRNFLNEVPSLNFVSSFDKLNNFKFSFKVDKDGIYILVQEIFCDEKKIGEYEIPIIAGFVDTGKVSYQHPGFVKKEEMVNMKISKNDLEKGYFLHFPTESLNFESLKEIQIDLGIGEEEFVEIELTNFKDMGKTEIEIKKSDYPKSMNIFIEENYRLYERNYFYPQPGKRNKFFITLDSKEVLSGDYECLISVKPEKSDETELRVKIKIWPVKFEEIKDTHVSFFWSSFECIFSVLYSDIKEKDKQLEIWRKCLKHMYRAGQRILEIRPEPISGKNPLENYIKVKEFKDGYIPILDLTGWTEILEIAKQEGMKDVIFRYGWYNKKWLPKDFNNLSEEKKEEIEFNILKQLYEHLKKLGFGRIFYYLIDELDPAKVDIVCERMEKIRKVVPDIEFAGSGFASTPLDKMQKIANYLTWIAPYWSVYNIYEWIETGMLKISPKTIIGTQVSGDHSQDYYVLRRDFWKMWKGNLNGYQIYGYYTFYSNHKYSCVFPDKEGPIISPTLLALIDGWEDFQYLWELNKVMEKSKKEKKEKIKKELNKIIGETNSLFIWKLTSSASFTYPVLLGEPQNLFEAKRIILRILSEEN